MNSLLTLSSASQSVRASGLSRALATCTAVLLLVAASTTAHAHHETSTEARSSAAPLIVLAQAGGTETPELEPRYEPVPPEEPDGYNEDYIFAITRALVDSTVVPAAKGPLFLLTVPLDLALLPVTLIGGFFG